MSTVADTATNLKVKMHSAMSAIVAGNASVHELDVVIGATNLAVALALEGNGTEMSVELSAGQLAVRNMRDRGVAGQGFTFTAEELNEVNYALEIHAAQLDIATINELDSGQRLVKKMLQQQRSKK